MTDEYIYTIYGEKPEEGDAFIPLIHHSSFDNVLAWIYEWGNILKVLPMTFGDLPSTMTSGGFIIEVRPFSDDMRDFENISTQKLRVVKFRIWKESHEPYR